MSLMDLVISFALILVGQDLTETSVVQKCVRSPVITLLLNVQ